ncbi:hypothetical protein Tco_0234597, partial [Tanacetum coccineum]
EEERPETLEPDWAVPPNDLPEPKNSRPMHLLHRIKTLKNTRYFRKLVIWARSSNGIADRLGSRSSAKLI